MSKVISGSLRLSGNAFQTDGLATENARQPNVVPQLHTVQSIQGHQSFTQYRLYTWGPVLPLTATLLTELLANRSPSLPQCV